MKKLMIKSKILLGFGIIQLLIIVVATIGVMKMSQMNNESQYMATIHLPSVYHAGSMSKDKEQIRNKEYRYLSNTTAEDKAQTEILTKKIASSYKEHLNIYRTNLVKNDEEKMLIDSAAIYFEQYMKLHDQMIAFSNEKKMNKARELMAGEARTVFYSWTEALDKLVELNKDEAATIAASSDKAFNILFYVVIIGVLFGSIMCIIMAFYIANGISRNLSQINEAAYNIAQGNLDINLHVDTKDEIHTLSQSFEVMINALKSLINDTQMLAKASYDGELNKRADVEKHQGDYQKIVKGMNETLDGIVAPLNIAGEYLDKISQGVIPEKITQEYKGEYNNLKNSINRCIDGLAGLIEANMVMQKLAHNDTTTKVEGQYLGIYAQMAEATNKLQDSLNSVTKALEILAIGDSKLSEAMSNSFTKRCENDRLIPAFLNLNKALNLIAEKAKQVATGDLTVSLDKRSENDELMGALNDMVTRLNAIVVEIIESAQNVASGSSQLSSTSVQIAEGANEQASAAEEVSSSIEEMNSTIQQNTDNAIQTEKIAKSAYKGIEEMSVAAMKSLDATKQIAEKIKIINSIAEKTDILAINAAIEAARAGEHGKGFAVVAAEVRKLAETSQKAAVEINTLSTSSLKLTQEGGELMSKLIPEIQRTSTLVQEIAAASNEQNSGAMQIAKAIDQLSSVTQENSASAEEMSSTAEELASQAEALQETIGFFTTSKDVSADKKNVQQAKQIIPVNKVKPLKKKIIKTTDVQDQKDINFESF